MPTPKQIKAAKKMSENVRKAKPDTLGKVLQDSGYSESFSKQPSRVTQSKAWEDLLEQYLPDDKLMEVHEQLLNTTKIEHMVFPLYHDPEADVPEEGDLPEEYLEAQTRGGALLRRRAVTEGSSLSDKDIEDMIAEVGCKVRKIVHGETARHVYFWSPDSTARKNAVELAYKIKGRITSKVKFDGEIRTNPFGGLSVDELRQIAEGRNGNN